MQKGSTLTKISSPAYAGRKPKLCFGYLHATIGTVNGISPIHSLLVGIAVICTIPSNYYIRFNWEISKLG